MRTFLLNVSLITSLAGFGQENSVLKTPCLTIEGTVTQKSIYIQNPENGEGQFCVDSVLINSIPFTTSLNQAAFEIPFSELGIEEGTSVFIQIYHKDECRPRLLTNAGSPQKKHVEFLEIKVED